jgi:hypothetical protein
VVGNVVALSVDRIYENLTDVFLPQALAQDIVDLALVAPLLVVAAALALRGSLRAYLLWLGALTFTVYNYVIYVVAIDFGPLFLLWVAVLGLALFCLIGGVGAADYAAVKARFAHPRAIKVTAWVLIVVAGLFALLWLSEDVPALLSGETPQSIADMDVLTNPVHVLDLAFFLPAAVLVGVWLLRGRPFAYVAAPALVVFLILTGVPIIVTPVVQAVRGETATWGILAPIGTLTVGLSALLWWLLAGVWADDSPSH